MMQTYYGGGDFDPYHRTSHRPPPTAAYYDRPVPYTYYEHPRHDLRAEYGGRPVTRAMVHDPETEMVHGQARRRIAVAVSSPIRCILKPGCRLMNHSARVAEDAKSNVAVTRAMAVAVKPASLRPSTLLRVPSSE